jgi:hypothetical protein
LQRAEDTLPDFNKRYYEVPNRRVRSFVGRADILRQIKDAFLFPKPSIHIIVLRGMGGQGKTQIALEVCRQMKEACPAIFWVDATSENSVKKDFEQIYERIMTNGDSQADTHSKAVHVQKAFCDWPHSWLMVFDNYDDPQGFSSIQDLIPQSPFARILITSRHADTLALTDEAGRIELPGLDQKDAIELLFKQSSLPGNRHNGYAASTIVERLGYHPLAIDQAGSYIYKRRISLPEFLIDYESRQKTILQEVPRMTQYRRKVSGIDQEIPLNVFTTCELSFRQLLANEDTRQTRGQFLTFMAFFYCSPFYEQVLMAFWNHPLRLAWTAETSHFLSECLGLSNGEWDSTLFLDRLVELRDLSLIQSFHKDQAGGSYLTMHPLIQDWLVLRMDYATCKRNSIWATNVLLCSVNNIYFLYGSVVGQYIARNNTNCKRFLQPAAIEGDDVHEWAFANALFSDTLVADGLYEDAESTIEEAICAIDQTDRNKSLAHVLKLKRHLACIRQLQCRWEDAKSLYREISWEMGTIDPKSTYTIQELASCRLDAKDESVVRMLCTYEEQTTLDNDDTCNKIYQYDVLNGFCWTLNRHRSSMEADLIMNEVLKQIKRMITPRPLPEAALVMEDAVEQAKRKMFVLRSKTDFEMEATAKMESILEGPVPLGFFDVLGRAIAHQGRAPKATAMLIDIVRRKLRVLSATQEPGVAACQLLRILLSIDSIEEAKTIIIPELIYQRILQGESHLEMLEILSLLTEALLRIGKFHDASRVAKKVLVGYRLRYGVKHPRTLQSQLRLAMALPLPSDNE